MNDKPPTPITGLGVLALTVLCLTLVTCVWMFTR